MLSDFEIKTKRYRDYLKSLNAGGGVTPAEGELNLLQDYLNYLASRDTWEKLKSLHRYPQKCEICCISPIEYIFIRNFGYLKQESACDFSLICESCFFDLNELDYYQHVEDTLKHFSEMSMAEIDRLFSPLI